MIEPYGDANEEFKVPRISFPDDTLFLNNTGKVGDSWCILLTLASVWVRPRYFSDTSHGGSCTSTAYPKHDFTKTLNGTGWTKSWPRCTIKSEWISDNENISILI